MAAGKGTRMKSAHSKVLQKLAGKPLLLHVLDTAAALGAAQAVVVTGHQAGSVEAAASAAMQGQTIQLQFARQEQQLGTGHAVQQALPHLPDTGMVLILSGDVPLTQAATLQALLAASGGDKLALLTIHLPDPTGYGRVIRAADGGGCGRAGSASGGRTRVIAALHAAASGCAVTVVTKDVLEHANTRFAQGGIAGVMFDDDSAAAHERDTLIAGAGLCDPDAVRVLVTEGPTRIRELIALGVAFDRAADGTYVKGLEAAHSYPRVLHAGGDATGSVIEKALVARVRASGAQIIEHAFLVDLILRGGRVAGVDLLVDDRRRAAERALLEGGDEPAESEDVNEE